MLETLKSLILDVWNVDVIMKGICEMTHMDDAEIFMITLIHLSWIFENRKPSC